MLKSYANWYAKLKKPRNAISASGLRMGLLRKLPGNRLLRVVTTCGREICHPEEMRVYRTNYRYYHVRISRDLFGQRVLIRTWGGLQNRLGGMAVEPLARGRLHQIDQERVQHGYRRVRVLTQ